MSPILEARRGRAELILGNHDPTFMAALTTRVFLFESFVVHRPFQPAIIF
jgi:calcineurin-like phosphoesterase family protein